jgi:hypothetical protein
MTSLRFFKSRKLESDVDFGVTDVPAPRPFKSGDRVAENIDYTLSSGKGTLHISPKAMQQLRAMGRDQEYISDLLHAVNVLENYSNRHINPAVFEQIKERYGLGLGTMTSIAAMSNLELADLGVDLRGLVRFYVRNKSDIRDIDELERFVTWLRSRGRTVQGVPSAWRHFCSLNGMKRGVAISHSPKKRLRARSYYKKKDKRKRG